MTQLHGEIPANADDCIGSFNVHRNTALSITTGSIITFNAEVWDVSSWYDTSTGRFTPQEAGIYRIVARAAIDRDDVPSWVFLDLGKNGSSYKLGNFEDTAVDNFTTMVDALVSLNGSTDYVTAIMHHGKGSSAPLMIGGGVCYMQGALVGRT